MHGSRFMYYTDSLACVGICIHRFQNTLLSGRDNDLVRDRPVDMHAVDSPARLERVRLHALDLLYDRRVFPGAGPRYEPPPWRRDLPVGQALCPELSQNLQLDERLPISSMCVNEGQGVRNVREWLTYSSGFARLKLSGSLRVTGGFVIKRGMRRRFFDAECGCIDVSRQPLLVNQ